MSVSCECCVLWGRGLCVGLITRPEESYRLWCVSECDREVSIMRRPWPTGGCRAIGKTVVYIGIMHWLWIMYWRCNLDYAIRAKCPAQRRHCQDLFLKIPIFVSLIATKPTTCLHSNIQLKCT
jgi:hypothetical protein